jgi:YidC/Oxa1 family membrane protein insertase
MGNIRLLLWATLAALIYLNYQAWMHDYPDSPVVSGTIEAGGAKTVPLGDSVPQAAAGGAPASTAPTTAASVTTPSTAAPGATEPTLGSPPTLSAPTTATGVPTADAAGAALLHVVTDVLDISINLKGGELDRADLLEYPLRKDTPNTPVRLLSREPPMALYLLQSGLAGSSGEAAPTHLATWQSAAQSYSLAPGADELRVPLTWSEQGLKVTKTFVFKRGQYAIALDYEVDNEGAADRKLASYTQILRHWEHASRSYFDVETYSFKGPAVYDGSKSKDLNVENDTDSKYSAVITGGWLASLQHQFVTAIVPPAGQPYQYQLQVRDKEYLLSATGPSVDVPPGGKAAFHEELFIGPKLQSQLAAVGTSLERTVDFGILTVLAQPLFTGLNLVHKLIGNWGWSIIIVTALIKLLFYPLSQASGRSMAKMRAVGPRMKQIQESFKDDREKLGRAMMELYKKEKINPLAGCLPMLVQVPVFISFYRVLLESVEMRQAPFLLWINDLSSRDPFFVLPLFMGAAMFAQFKLNPAPPDPTQAKVMQFMPLVMTGMMAWFPSGLVLYWLTNTVLSIVQQWRVNQVVSVEANKPRS